MKRMVTSAVFAGVVAGLFAALLQFVFVEKLILLAEDYESGTKVHFAGVPGAAGEADHDHDHAVMSAETTTPDAAPVPDVAPEMAATGEHDHQHEAAEAEGNPLTRHLLTLGFIALVYTGYGLMMVAGFALADQFGVTVSARDGLLWGIAGFVAFQLAPAMGLPPELPGTPAADLTSRQIWWVGTAVATAAALALIGYRPKPWALVVALVLLALPHVIGAPELDGFGGVVPPELSAAFAARSLGVGLAAWALLGWLAGQFWDRSATT